MKRFWTGCAGAVLLAGLTSPSGFAAAEEPLTQSQAAETQQQATSGERASETPRSDSPSLPQRVLPSRAGDRRGGVPVWIGAMCLPADATLRVQLGLADGVGLVVARVMPGSPADTSGLKVHDVVAAIDGRPAADVAGLMKAVDEAGAAGLKLEIIRVGKKQTLAVVPSERPTDDVLAQSGLALPRSAGTETQLREEHVRRLQEQIDKLRGRLPEADEKRLQEWLDQMKRGENQPLRLQLFGPGLVMQGGALPEGVNIVILRNGDEPTRVIVTRGAEKWEVTEKEIDKLPEELRETVRAMIEKN